MTAGKTWFADVIAHRPRSMRDMAVGESLFANDGEGRLKTSSRIWALQVRVLRLSEWTTIWTTARITANGQTKLNSAITGQAIF
jgi:hypothetical protein